MKTAHVYIYGEIANIQDDFADSYGIVSLKGVKNQLDNQPGFEDITVHIHCVGGDVTEGFAIHDFLKSQGKPITTIIEGMCASIATVPALSGSIRKITKNSTFFIHNPWGFIGGEKEEMRKYADELEDIENKLSDFYVNNSNLTKDEALQFMKVETSFTAEQALANGLVTEIVDQVKAVASLKKEIFKPQNDMNYTKKELDEKFKKQEGFFEKILNKLSGKGNIVALKLQDANASEIDFPDVPEGEDPKVGDKATLDGSPIPDGDYVFPSLENSTISFVDGAITAITPAEEEEEETADVAALRTENEDLKAQITNLTAQNSANETLVTEAATAIKSMKKEFDSLKKSIGSSYNYKPEVDGNERQPAGPAGVKRTPLKK